MKSYSITVLPDSIRGKHLSLTLKGSILFWSLLMGAVFFILISCCVYFFIIAPYASVQSRSAKSQELIVQNTELSQRINIAQAHMEAMDEKLDKQLELTDKLYFLFGITEIGGGGYTAATEDDYARRLDTLDLIERRYHLLERYLSSFHDLPIRMPLKDMGRLSSDFGPRRSPFSDSAEMHRGIDLTADIGTPVYAAGGGEVIMAGRWQQYNSSEFAKLGKFVMIKHGETGYETIYGHCSRVLVKEGDIILPGQEIAKVGNTGWSTGPHLHFAILLNKQFVDPKLYLLHFDSVKFLEQVLVESEKKPN
jgi:murein DD-endopeptidase MepM/ murein hydrolase activator NlpD